MRLSSLWEERIVSAAFPAGVKTYKNFFLLLGLEEELAVSALPLMLVQPVQLSPVVRVNKISKQ